MIVTVTLNPAIDKTIYVDDIVFDIGGKGINVSKVLNNFGLKSIVTGFVGKENKQLLIDDLNSLGIENHMIEVEGKIHTNTKRIIDNDLVEENEDGPIITEEDIEKLIKYLSKFKNDIVVLSGSAPSSVKDDIYQRLVKLLKQNNNYVILDTNARLLFKAIQEKPDIIKPNKDEICELFNCEFGLDVMEKCKNLNLDLVVLSLGKDGAYFINDKVYYKKALKVNYKSAVGAGDSMVAALVYSKVNNFDIEKTIDFVMAAAACACETVGTKPAKLSDIEARLKQ